MHIRGLYLVLAVFSLWDAYAATNRLENQSEWREDVFKLIEECKVFEETESPSRQHQAIADDFADLEKRVQIAISSPFAKKKEEFSMFLSLLSAWSVAKASFKNPLPLVNSDDVKQSLSEALAWAGLADQDPTVTIVMNALVKACSNGSTSRMLSDHCKPELHRPTRYMKALLITFTIALIIALSALACWRFHAKNYQTDDVVFDTESDLAELEALQRRKEHFDQKHVRPPTHDVSSERVGFTGIFH